jgi:uncharacterized protein (DUF433 family)
MAIGIEYPHIEKTDGHPARLAEHPRIRIAQIVMDYLAYGWSAEELCRQHEYLTLSDAHAALLYYWDHRDEVDGEIREELEAYERERNQAPPSPLAIRLKVHKKVAP